MPGTEFPAAPLPRGIAELDKASQRLKEGRNDEAFELLKEATRTHPELPPARLMMGMLLFSANQVQQGRRQLEQAAVETPHHPEVYATFGRLALAEGRLSDALLNFQKASSLPPPEGWDQAQQRRFRLANLDGLAAVAEGRNDWSSARDSLAARLELEPKDGKTRQRLARALFLMARTEEAFKQFQQASKDDTTLEPAAVSMARLYAVRRDHKKATEWVDYALRLSPGDPRVHLAKASWLLEQGRIEEAKAPTEAAAKLDPKSAAVKRQRGMIALCLKNYAEAERQFQALAQELPDDSAVHGYLALSLVEQEDEARHRRALELAEANARQHPGDSETLAILGWVDYRLGHLDEAERAFQAAASRGQMSADAAYHLAVVLAARGRADDARKLIKSALETSGFFLAREEARRWLERQPDQPRSPQVRDNDGSSAKAATP